MGQGAAKAKQGGEEAAVQKTTEKKDEKKAHKSNDADALIAFMKKHYDEKVKGVNTFDDFYHAIHELIEKFCEERGQLQYRIPTKVELQKQYDKVHSGSSDLTQDQFEKIARGIVKMDSFTFGKAAVDILALLFGLPVCAVLAKRVVPGLKSISDDIVIPAATSGAVIWLAKHNKL